MSIAEVIDTYGQTVAEESGRGVVLRIVETRTSWRRVLALPSEVARKLDGVSDELPAACSQQAQHQTIDLMAVGWDIIEFQPASDEREYPVVVRDFAGQVHSCANDDKLLDLLVRLDETAHAKKRRAKMIRDLMRVDCRAIGQVGLERAQPVSDVRA